MVEKHNVTMDEVEEFASYEEAAEFWDTHDTTDYPAAFRTVEVKTEFRGRYYEIEIAEDVVIHASPTPEPLSVIGGISYELG